MQAIPLVRSGSVRPILDFIEQLGACPGRAMAHARPLLVDPTALIPMPMAGVLFEEAKVVAGDAAFGLRVGAATRPVEYHEWGTVLKRARTLAGLLGTIGTAARRFNTGQQFWSVQRGEDVWLHWRYTSRMTEGRRVVADFTLMLVLQAIRLAAGAEWRPDELHLEGAPPAHAAELASLATMRTFFEQPYTALVFPARFLADRFPPILIAPERSGANVPSEDFEGSIRQLVESLRKLGALDLSVAAESVRMSERSLQRRLAECGLSFARVVDDVRFDTACSMLSDPARKIIEISAELGYSDSANFTRAFRRWSGVSPQAFRRTG